jgi:putative aldouronate transport system permease protein
MTEKKPMQRPLRLHTEHFRRNLELFILCIPIIVILFLFQYLPMPGLVMAFKKFRPLEGIWGSPWNGLKNFEFFTASSQIWLVTRNTILYNLGFLVLTPICAVAVAVILYEIGNPVQIKVYQTIFFLPHFLSWVVVSIMLYAFLNTDQGYLNRIILGLGGEKISWYTEAGYWPFILVFMGLWKTVGYNVVIYYAGLVGIDPGLYEAAAIDGAGRWKRTVYITIPLLVPLLVILTILGLGRIFFADFGLFYQLPLRSGPLLPTTDVINYYTIRTLMIARNYGMGTAIGLYQSVMGLILVLITNWASKKVSRGEHGLF